MTYGLTKLVQGRPTGKNIALFFLRNIGPVCNIYCYVSATENEQPTASS